MSEYVYENPETGEISSVVFEGEDKETEDAQPKPSIVTIVSKPWDSNETLIWREQNGTEHSLAYNTELTTPFLHDGKLFAIHQANNAMVELMLNETVLKQTDAGWTINGYFPNPLSVVRGNYKMHSDCSVYEFNTTTKTITQLAAPKSNHGYVANAGQNALYCMFSDADDDTALPKFFRFEIDKAIANQPATTTVNAASGTKLDANERMAVISDNELMFYQSPYGIFTEYYVNFDAGTTIEKQVGSVTTIKMQTIKSE